MGGHRGKEGNWCKDRDEKMKLESDKERKRMFQSHAGLGMVAGDICRMQEEGCHR